MDIYDEPFLGGGAETVVSSVSSVSLVSPTYCIIPDLENKNTFLQFILVLILFFAYMVFFIYISSYGSSYTPNLSMFVDFITNGSTTSQSNFKEYIEGVVENQISGKQSAFTTQNATTATTATTTTATAPKKEGFNGGEKSTLFDRIRRVINGQIMKLFYIKGNTIRI
jgi:hypothetical protein